MRIKLRSIRYLIYYLRMHPIAIVGYVIVWILLFLALVGRSITPFDPETANPVASLSPPSFTHFLGTDVTGMDIFSRLIAAARIDIGIGICATMLAMLIGVPLGAAVTYFRKLGVLMRMVDPMQAFPIYILAMALVTLMGHNVANVIYVVAFVTTPTFVRLVRSEAISVCSRTFVEAARATGVSDFIIFSRHVIPNSMTPALIQMSYNIALSILITAGISFVGAGVRAPTPEWGLMISEGSSYILTGHWWIAFFPGLTLFGAAFGFAVVSDSWTYVLDPKRRR